MPLLALTDCKIVDKFFVGIFLNDIKDTTKYESKNRIYVLLESPGTTEFINYFENIILNCESLIRYYTIDINYIMCVFEFASIFTEDFNNLIVGNYKLLTNKFKDKVKKYFDNWENIIDTRNTSVFDVKELLIKITSNSKELIEDYWETNCDDIEWLTNIMNKNGNYWSAPEENLNIFSIDYLEKWKE